MCNKRKANSKDTKIKSVRHKKKIACQCSYKPPIYVMCVCVCVEVHTTLLKPNTHTTDISDMPNIKSGGALQQEHCFTNNFSTVRSLRSPSVHTEQIKLKHHTLLIRSQRKAKLCFFATVSLSDIPRVKHGVRKSAGLPVWPTRMQ
jgi:hypothetical protein